MGFRTTSLLFAVALLAGSSSVAVAQKAEPLKGFSFTIKPGSYVDLHGGKVYAEKDAAAHKAELDFVYLASREGGSVKRELYDLSGKDTKLPADVLGNKAGIVALSWADDLVEKCRTTADLKRMTTSYTASSFSFYATVTNNRTGDLDSRRFIFTDHKGRMGIFTVKAGPGDDLQVDGKITP